MAPRIVILEDIHADGIELMREWADVSIQLGLPRDQLLASTANFDAIVVKSVTAVDEELYEAASQLRVVGRAGTGTDNIDLEAAARRDLPVVTVPTGNTISAAEFTVALMLTLTRRIAEAGRAVAGGDFRRHLLEGRELSTLTVGLVGLGNVGRNVAQRLLPFGCRVMGWDPFPTAGEAFVKLGGTLCDSFTQMLPQLDLLSFHVPLTPQTANMLDRDALHNVKPGLRVINTARGGVIDPDALLEAVEDGRVSAAALDVISPEPPFDAEPGTASFSHPLLGHPRILVTPHMAASTSDAQQRIAVQLAASLKKALIG